MATKPTSPPRKLTRSHSAKRHSKRPISTAMKAKLDGDISYPWYFQHNVHVSCTAPPNNVASSKPGFTGLPAAWEEELRARVEADNAARAKINGKKSQTHLEATKPLVRLWVLLASLMHGMSLSSACKEDKGVKQGDEQGDKSISAPWGFRHHYHGSVSMTKDGFEGLPQGWNESVMEQHSHSSAMADPRLCIADVDEFGSLSKEKEADEAKSEAAHDELSCLRPLRYQRQATSTSPGSPGARRSENNSHSMSRHFSLRKPKSKRNLSTYSVS